MLRFRSVSQAGQKRTIRPLYGFTQATPKAVLLDANWDRRVDIYPGMALQQLKGNSVTLVGGASGTPGATATGGTVISAGLAGMFVAPRAEHGAIDEVADQGTNVFAMWVMGPDAEFEILAPAFDDSVAWVESEDGTPTYVAAYTDGAHQGKLCPAKTEGGGVTAPLARLIRVVSPQKIVIGGLQGTV